MDRTEDRKSVINQIRDVIDPEIGMNIVDVGLIYGIEINDSNKVVVRMTLTTPGCPLTDFFVSEIETKLMDLEWVDDVEIVFTWTPQWDLIMMDEDAKQRMFEGIRG
jgi:metal-sulfur cluster biosynthetic enzyme